MHYGNARCPCRRCGVLQPWRTELHATAPAVRACLNSMACTVQVQAEKGPIKAWRPGQYEQPNGGEAATRKSGLLAKQGYDARVSRGHHIAPGFSRPHNAAVLECQTFSVLSEVGVSMVYRHCDVHPVSLMARQYCIVESSCSCKRLQYGLVTNASMLWI